MLTVSPTIILSLLINCVLYPIILFIVLQVTFVSLVLHFCVMFFIQSADMVYVDYMDSYV
jgi:hypothetical protein